MFLMTRIWSYTGENGPEFWPELSQEFYEAAQFPLQSPISLSYEETQPLYKGLAFHYEKQAFSIKNVNDTIHFEPVNTTSFVDFLHDRYYLTDIHFHMPSEHIIANEQTSLEFHLVHKNNYGDPLVCAVLFYLTKEPAPSWAEDNNELLFDPSLFLPMDSSYFHYEGSLTTPPTDGPVKWFVFDQKRPMSSSFMERFKTDLLPNNRPLQDKKQRLIYYKK